MTQPTVASFFAGIGGFDLGFEQADFKVIFQCEKDKFCQGVLKKRFKGVPLVSDINDPEILSNIPNADVWTGGFPCQDVSRASPDRAGLAGGRSGLFYRFAELVGSHPKRPRWLVLENVPGLLNSNEGADFQTVLQTLDKLGYFVAWRMFDAQHFGTPQRRRRVFLVASYSNDGAARVLLEPGTLGEVAMESRSSRSEPGSFAAEGNSKPTLYAIQHATIGRRPSWSGPQSKGLRGDGLTFTLDSRGSSDVVFAPNDGFGIRKASGVSKELDGRRLRACGNAVNVKLVTALAAKIHKHILSSMLTPEP